MAPCIATLFVLVALLAVQVHFTAAFTAGRVTGWRLRANDRVPSHVLRSEPSDVETDEVSVHSSSTAAYNAPKEFLLDGSAALTRSEINEFVLALEKLNPTPEPANSRLLNGVWEVKSTGFGSPGLVGLQVLKAISKELVDSVTVTISSVAPRVVATTSLRVASAKIDFSVTTDLESLGGMRLKETVSSVKVGSLDVPLSTLTSNAPVLTSREIFITYLDEDLLVARDSFGTPEILTRKNAPVRASSEESQP